MSRPRVVLADDHRVVAEGLKRLLSDDFELVAVVADGVALVEAATNLRPEVIIADISMPRLNGLEAVARLKAAGCDAKIIFLTMHQEPAYARRALEAGAAGYVLKHSAPAELVTAVHWALEGRTFITPLLAGEVVQQAHNKPRGGGPLLTPRQSEILRLLSQGLSTKEIASSLGISPRTVEFHKYQMMEANGLHGNAELIHFAIRHGIVTI
jgi:DNA-binding NarL/FixJ family response regulator